MKLNLILVIFLFHFSFTWAQSGKGEIIDEIIAVVGDEIITKSDLQAKEAEYLARGLVQTDDSDCTMLEEILYQKLLLNQAKIDSIEVTDEEVNGQLDQRMNYYLSKFPQESAFTEFYGKTPTQFKKEIEDDLRDEIMSQKMQAQIAQNINVTPKDVETFYGNFPKDSLPLIESEVQYSHISVKPKIRKAKNDEIVEKLNGYREELLKNPYKFGLYATLYSEDPGSANNQNQGCYRKVERGVMVPEFEEAVLNLQEGQITEPFKSDFGWHIARLEEKSGLYYDVCHILMTPEIVEEDYLIAQEEIEKIKTLILTDSLSFEAAANIYSDDKETKKAGGVIPNPYTGGTKHELSKIDPRVTLVLNQLEPKQVSDAVLFDTSSGQKEYRIHKLNSRSNAHVANLKDDYALLKMMTQSDVQNITLEEWIKKKLDVTYKRLNDNYSDCDFRYNWNFSNKN